ncbi:MAG: AAA family ATPase, partial [Methanotrichaceae archaeon]|nr:AAA family ATPase [Methanotrichaceae archaeon]
MKPPSVERVGGLFKVTWEDQRICIEMDRVSEHSDEIRAQITVIVAGLVVAQFGHNLTSLPARDKAAKYLKDRHDTDWGMLLEMASYYVLKRLREGEPVVDLSMVDEIRPISWMLKPLLQWGMPTTIFADGGTGKSYLSLLIAMLVGFPWQDNPFRWQVPSSPVPSLLLDWETEKDVVTYRINLLCKGMKQPRPPLHYRRCSRPLALDLPAIQRHLLDSGAKLLIVDSLGMACGGDLKEQASATAFFTALRELQVTSLLLTHMAKDDLRQKKTAFGSIYFQNHSRSVWE